MPTKAPVKPTHDAEAALERYLRRVEIRREKEALHRKQVEDAKLADMKRPAWWAD